MVLISSWSGSSPRGRGKLFGGLVRRRLDGLIPARAGKTDGRRRCPAGGAAHPRAGGENHPLRTPSTRAAGSSPRGRGKLAPGRIRAMLPRLIPARAGKTTATTLTALRPRAHPRAGGENGQFGGGHDGWSGSSPRGRGKQRARANVGRRVRLIPARAGKTRLWSGGTRTWPAHPRAGGENSLVERRPRLPLGLIPARAGKTPPSQSGTRR